jgi:putative hemolysin
LRIFGIKPDEPEEAASEEELRIMLDTSSERGEIDTLENEMIQNIFEFDDISVSEVCTHRKKVSFLHSDDTIDGWKKNIAKSRHGYYPICGETVDDIIAVLNVKKFFRCECKNIAMAMRLAAEKPYLVPENTKADVLFNNMKQNKNYFAVVVDEYGGTLGVITIHDLLELLVGDMDDKEDAVVIEIEQIEDEKWRILGSSSLEDVEELLEIKIEAEDCDTFAGYILSLLGEIPDDGSVFDFETENLIIHIESVKDHTIQSTVVYKKQLDEVESDEDDQ